VQLADGDVMEIQFEGFGRALQNPVSIAKDPQPLVKVNAI
jgi:hypothetical protein